MTALRPGMTPATAPGDRHRTAVTPAVGPAPDLAALAARERQLRDTLDEITHGIFEVGMTLNGTAGVTPGELRSRIDEASRQLDDMLNGIYRAMLPGSVP